MSDLTISHPETSASWPIIAAVIGAMSVFSMTLGLSYPLLALILENLGTPKTLIGLNAAMTPLGIIVSSPVIPRLTRYKGSWGLAMLCLLFTLLFFVLIGATRRIEFWFIVAIIIHLGCGRFWCLHCRPCWAGRSLFRRDAANRQCGFWIDVGCGRYDRTCFSRWRNAAFRTGRITPHPWNSLCVFYFHVVIATFKFSHNYHVKNCSVGSATWEVGAILRGYKS